ncbi:MAG: TraR/DksA C4-type zinc finger protein [Actinomycetota bacterium]|nr:TraR/DksA C4-type zinc finger protein [Actinomycetota bacterium]MBW3641396.1 TraR/DksA C4-type zinc finger protein [Actinomycetota bacterium]MDP9005674.1 TraR/DksA C4-type zinc finger protein [Actinomycetota bacterium]
MLTSDALQNLRTTLCDERDHLRRQLADLGVGGEGMAFDENFADSGQVAAEKGEHQVLANNLQEALADVDRALQKLDDGAYGRCEHCGVEIGEARLEAMPATRYCIDCATRR